MTIETLDVVLFILIPFATGFVAGFALGRVALRVHRGPAPDLQNMEVPQSPHMPPWKHTGRTALDRDAEWGGAAEQRPAESRHPALAGPLSPVRGLSPRSRMVFIPHKPLPGDATRLWHTAEKVESVWAEPKAGGLIGKHVLLEEPVHEGYSKGDVVFVEPADNGRLVVMGREKA